MRIAVVDDVPADREKLAADIVSWARERCDMARLEQERFLVLPGPGGLQRLLLHHIAWTEYENRRVWVHVKDGRETQVLLNQGQLSELLLREPFFCDCIKGILVNFEAVDKLLPDRFLLKTGQSIPVSRLKYREIRDRFFAYSYERARKRLE